MPISTYEWSFHIVQQYNDSPVYCKDYQNIFRFSQYFKSQLCCSSHWLVVHKMGLLQRRSLYPNARFWCKSYEWHHSWQEHFWPMFSISGTETVLTKGTPLPISCVKPIISQEIKTAESDFTLSLMLALCWYAAYDSEAIHTITTILHLAEIL